MVYVLETDQWTSTGNLREASWDELQRDGIERVTGGDSEAARRIFGGHFHFRHVEEDARPSIGNVWFRRGEDNRPELWKANYDSSD